MDMEGSGGKSGGIFGCEVKVRVGSSGGSGVSSMSWSPYAANFFFIKKHNGKLRPVQDYRPINKWTRKNRNSMPLIPQTINRLTKCTLFTKFDVRWGYNNVRIKPGY